MNKIKVKSDKIKLAGSGESVQWGAIIGMAIDKYLNLHPVPPDSINDQDLLKSIKDEVNSSELSIPDIKTLPQEKIKIIDELLKGTSKNLSSKDLKKIF